PSEYTFKMFQLLILFLTGILAMDIPNCDFFDTVDISSSEQLSDGSYIYEGVHIPATLTGSYDYQIDPAGKRETVPKHIRGCVCQLKACVRLCCPYNQFREATKCVGNTNPQNITWDYSLNVTLDDGSVKIVDFLKDMIHQHDTPFSCYSYPLDARDPNDTDFSWALYENGSLLRHFDSQWLSKTEYCLQPALSKDQKEIYMVANNCAIDGPKTMAYVKLASAFFLVVTIAIYLWLPRFRHIHGRCCVLYFACLASAFVLNAASTFRVFDGNIPMCPINGFVGYFMVMSTFLWLSVIGFNVWLGFLEKIPSSSPSEVARRFWYYHIYVWTTATLLTLIVFLVSTFVPKNESNLEYVPYVYGEYGCWISTYNYSALTYFYFPMGVLVTVNGIFFYLTIRRIYGQHRSIRSTINQDNAHQDTGASYQVYVRLFIVMGCNWILEFVSYICQMENVAQDLRDVNELINCCEGITIFLVTICSRRTI
ncbi:hypothetical protein KR026_003431, partial [Drosophila bipectinata]